MEEDDKDQQKAIASLLSSGFPFQTAVARLVAGTEGWSVLREEFPWRDHDGTDRFLDVVATNGPIVVAIECKKTQKDTYTFLLSGSHSDTVTRVQCVSLGPVGDSTNRLGLWFRTCQMAPGSVEASYCVVNTDSSERLLERMTQPLVRAIAALAATDRTLRASAQEQSSKLLVPIVVTNASLRAAVYNPATDVSLDTGQMQTGTFRSSGFGKSGRPLCRLFTSSTIERMLTRFTPSARHL